MIGSCTASQHISAICLQFKLNVPKSVVTLEGLEFVARQALLICSKNVIRLGAGHLLEKHKLIVSTRASCSAHKCIIV